MTVSSEMGNTSLSPSSRPTIPSRVNVTLVVASSSATRVTVISPVAEPPNVMTPSFSVTVNVGSGSPGSGSPGSPGSTGSNTSSGSSTSSGTSTDGGTTSFSPSTGTKFTGIGVLGAGTQ